jgi:hypothetical protein
MNSELRNRFNQAFSQEKYEMMLEDITSDFNYRPTFRIAETPLFIPDGLKNQLAEACGEIISFIKSKHFKPLTEKALDLNKRVAHEDAHPNFLAIDFGICEEEGQVIPKLIEVQGFPSLFHFQAELFQKFQTYYPEILEQQTSFWNSLNLESYYQVLKEVIIQNHQPQEVVLLEIEPEKQNTKIDFYYCQKALQIPILCVTEVYQKDNKLFYVDKLGNEIQIKRIYNRVIFDELDLRTDLKLRFDFTAPLEVTWAGHPNWFFRISKFILPYLKGPYFIETTLLSDLKEIPEDLENYVLKPLFSFSGTGVIFHVKKEDVLAVQEKELYILQKKVYYIPFLQAPDGKVKAEVRILYVWPDESQDPQPVTNLVRLSRGEMIGVKYNKDKDWVGGTIGLFNRS